MKKLLILFTILVTGFYAASSFFILILTIIGFIFIEDVRTNVQDLLSTLTTESLVGFLIITQLTIVPIIAGWISHFLYKQYKLLK